MADEFDLERAEPASQRRLEQAREEGQVPQSRELSAFLVLVAGAGGIWLPGTWLASRVGTLLRHGLTLDRRSAFDSQVMGARLADLGGDARGMAVTLVDEHRGQGSATAILGARARYDLLQAVNGDVPLTQAVVIASEPLRLIPAARLAQRTAGRDAPQHSRLTQSWRSLCSACDLILVDAHRWASCRSVVERTWRQSSTPCCRPNCGTIVL